VAASVCSKARGWRAPLEEESEEDDDVVALRDHLGALLAEHQAKDEDGRPVGHRRNGVDEKGEGARQAEDEVDEAWLGLGLTSGVGLGLGPVLELGSGLGVEEVEDTVGEGEGGLAADLLVDGVAEVDDRAHGGAENGADDGKEAVGDHSLADGVCKIVSEYR
jgi:hypothetical protein